MCINALLIALSACFHYDYPYLRCVLCFSLFLFKSIFPPEAPGFVALRDLVDYERFLELGNSWFKSVHSLNHTLTLEDDILTTNFFKPLSDLDASEIATKLFIATRQVMVVFELDRLYTLQKFVKSRPKIATDIKEKLFKDYRLMVKHRLRNQEMELLHSCTSKQAMKDMLTAMYDESFSRYSSILTRVHR